MDERTFLLNRERAVDYLNMLDRLYVFDGYAGWDPEVTTAHPLVQYHLFQGIRLALSSAHTYLQAFFVQQQSVCPRLCHMPDCILLCPAEDKFT